jgi:F-type H+-transporting ATPase subunit gamma
MDRSALFSSLVRQYLFITLFHTFAESLAAENASRLAAMQAAEKNIQDQLDQLNFAFQQDRQNTITAELLDIIAGFETLTTDSGNS